MELHLGGRYGGEEGTADLHLKLLCYGPHVDSNRGNKHAGDEGLAIRLDRSSGLISTSKAKQALLLGGDWYRWGYEHLGGIEALLTNQVLDGTQGHQHHGFLTAFTCQLKGVE